MITNKEAAKEIALGAAFQANSLSGVWVSSMSRASVGKLSSFEAARFLTFIESTTAPVYVVYSYATPIAWADATGRYSMTTDRFSATTSRHMSIARSIIDFANSRSVVVPFTVVFTHPETLTA